MFRRAWLLQYRVQLAAAQRSRAALVAAAQANSHPWERRPADFFADAERIRELAASLFGGEADGCAIVPAASYGLSAAARAIQPMLKTGDRIVVLDDGFPPTCCRGVAWPKRQEPS